MWNVTVTTWPKRSAQASQVRSAVPYLSSLVQTVTIFWPSSTMAARSPVTIMMASGCGKRPTTLTRPVGASCFAT